MTEDSANPYGLDSEDILAAIVDWVSIETPTPAAEAVNRLADRVEALFRQCGASVERTPGRDGFGDILKARAPWGGDGPGLLVLSHIDTVHPLGTLARDLPIRRDGDHVYGPGILDMKSGAYMACHALRWLADRGRTTPLPITFLITPDEEVGSPTSRAMIEAEGRRAKYVLVTEAARDGGKVVTARRGSGRFVVRAHGRPAHSGGAHQAGRSAIREMARQILRLEDMTDYGRDITVNVGNVAGGTAVNVVPAYCEAEVDLRMPDATTGAEMEARIRGLTPVDPDVALEIEGVLNRPAYSKTPAIEALFEQARVLARDLGFDVADTRSGGGSDGSFTAALGVPTLDGLGADGEGFHTLAERIAVSSLVPRTSLMLRLFETLA